MRILHITECYGGGVSKAIDTFTILAPKDIDHLILWEGEDDPRKNKNFGITNKFSSGLISRLFDVRKTVEKEKPDFILAHSSWAGFYTRIIAQKVPVIYQPHCYVFEDKSRNLISRIVYFLAEKYLSRNSEATVILSPRENFLAKKVNSSSPTIYLPNINSLGISYKFKSPAELYDLVSSRGNTETTVAMLGRISPQKDPEWFIRVVNIFNEKYGKNENIKFLWIGDGDHDLKNKLLQAGVQVTGWKQSEEILNIFNKVDIYLHTASYEGFPLAILDALSLDIPTVARQIEAYQGTEINTVRSASEAADDINKLIKSTDYKVERISAQSQLMKSMNEHRQQESIKKIIDLFQ